MNTIYTEAEEYLIKLNHNLVEVNETEFELLAEDITNEEYESVGFGIELGRCPSTDRRTYILHVGHNGEAYYEQYIGFEWLKPKEINKILKG